jgi:hypothetical protein
VNLALWAQTSPFSEIKKKYVLNTDWIFMLISSYFLRLADGAIQVLNVAIVINVSNCLPLTRVYGRVMFGWIIIILMVCQINNLSTNKLKTKKYHIVRKNCIKKMAR